VIEGVGTGEALEMCFKLARHGGTVSFVGLFWEPASINMTDFFLRNLTLRGGVAPARAYIPKLMPLVESGKLDPTHIIYRLPLSQAPKGYELMDKRKEGVIKVVLSP